MPSQTKGARPNFVRSTSPKEQKAVIFSQSCILEVSFLSVILRQIKMEETNSILSLSRIVTHLAAAFRYPEGSKLFCDALSKQPPFFQISSNHAKFISQLMTSVRVSYSTLGMVADLRRYGLVNLGIFASTRLTTDALQQQELDLFSKSLIVFPESDSQVSKLYSKLLSVIHSIGIQPADVCFVGSLREVEEMYKETKINGLKFDQVNETSWYTRNLLEF